MTPTSAMTPADIVRALTAPVLFPLFCDLHDTPHDSLHRPASSPCPPTARRATSTVDLPAPPGSLVEPIKADPLSPQSSHHSTPLSSLILLDHFPLSNFCQNHRSIIGVPPEPEQDRAVAVKHPRSCRDHRSTPLRPILTSLSSPSTAGQR